jgi:hypothetical protein
MFNENGRSESSQLTNRPFLKVLYPTSRSPLTITRPPRPCNLMPYEGQRCARCSTYTLVPIVDLNRDSCKRRPRRRRVGKDSYAHVRVSGQWVIKLLQHNKLSNVGASPEYASALQDPLHTWQSNFLMVCTICIGV